ncbi:DUF262 domain-containing protein [Mesobacillus foraminis]|uniref:Uncharacterized protein DUF262 n=1 Tax=Mesobacillus foraminis TaxID=279826 RepID=A0A4R2AZ32_9BACI|nr:DUF262 domain-containing protein [Mesobacillus foraminis]TCN18935.1 uncharacterized protein DUF262 [Mesobacillus foraminis]
MSIKSYTEVKQIRVQDIVDGINAQVDNTNVAMKIRVPKIQRNLVWSQSQKEKFIDTLKQGFPFGSLLLYKKGSEDYLLVDGLQRTSTILEYSLKPTQYFSKNEIKDHYITSLLSIFPTLSSSDEEKVREKIEQWVKGKNGFTESEKFSSYNLVKFLESQLLSENISLSNELFEEIMDILSRFIDSVKSFSDISKIEMPVVVYHGEESNLPEIFERINSKGTKLNRYQIFAATWEKEFQIQNKSIIDAIKLKYEKLIESGFVIDNYDSNNLYQIDTKFTLFEYLFGVGKFIQKTYPMLFGRPKEGNEDSTDSLGFNIVSICRGVASQELKSLEDRMLEIDINRFETAFLQAIDFVQTALSPVLAFQAHRAKRHIAGDYKIFHGESQIVALIGSVFHIRFDQNLSERSTWKQDKIRLLNTLPAHYLYDLLRDYWRGSSDSKLKQIIVDPIKNNIGSLIDNLRYGQLIPKEQWNSILTVWFEEQLNRKESKRINIGDKEILFLKYLYKNIFTFDETYSLYEIDHVLPIERLRKAAVNLNGLPISCVANLAFIPKESNNRKQDKTFYEYLTYLKEKCGHTDKQIEEQRSLFDRLLFISCDELIIPKQKNADNITREWYTFVLRKRFERMKALFLSNI